LALIAHAAAHKSVWRMMLDVSEPGVPSEGAHQKNVKNAPSMIRTVFGVEHSRR
jgi:hypothetical protein